MALHLVVSSSAMSDPKKSSSSPSGPDLELKRAFAELQAKMVENKQKMKIADMQIDNLNR